MRRGWWFGGLAGCVVGPGVIEGDDVADMVGAEVVPAVAGDTFGEVWFSLRAGSASTPTCTAPTLPTA